jgi:hypothetical protein
MPVRGGVERWERLIDRGGGSSNPAGTVKKRNNRRTFDGAWHKGRLHLAESSRDRVTHPTHSLKLGCKRDRTSSRGASVSWMAEESVHTTALRMSARDFTPCHNGLGLDWMSGGMGEERGVGGEGHIYKQQTCMQRQSRHAKVAEAEEVAVQQKQ